MGVLYHFQHQSEYGGRWQAIGSGEGFGRDPVRDAFADLRSLADGDLPAGLYQYLPAGQRTLDARWRFLNVSKGGSVRISRL